MLQSLAPASITVGAIVLEILLAVIGGWTLRRRGWPKARTALIVAAPVPFLIIAMCVIVFVSAATASAESCGVDACAMAMMAAMALGSAAVVLYIIGAVAGGLTAQFTRRSVDRPNVADIFE